MAKTVRTTSPPLIDALRQLDGDGPLVSLVCSTYGLALDQPNFFEQDFLPTALGLGGVRDRGYAIPVALERKLKEVYSALVVDAHALNEGGRPSLQIDVLPVGLRTNHAKLVLIHRKRLIRLVVASANLTHDGYRRQREVAAVLDFKTKGLLPFEVLRNALHGWSEVLGELCPEPLKVAFDGAVSQVEEWSLPKAFQTGRGVSVVFGGGPRPLWRALVEAWPKGEPLLDWYVCSPFWPDPIGGETPFEAIARGLTEREVSLDQARLQIIACADSVGERGRPKFPFRLVRQLFDSGFPIRCGQIAPARLEAVEQEIPEGMAEDQRDLHAKWVVLRGPTTALALLGSANFTRKGLGVLARPEEANIEACVLLTLPAAELDPRDWMPPLAEKGIVDFSTCQESQLQEPAPEEEDFPPWPAFIARIEVEVRWHDGPDPTGVLRLVMHSGTRPAFTVSTVAVDDEPPKVLLSADATEQRGKPIEAAMDSWAMRRLLTERAVLVGWGEPTFCTRFPVNVDESSKAGLPSVLGARPDEQQLLAYFHGRLAEEDLIELLERQSQQVSSGGRPETPEESARLRQLQNYIIRDFVEGLFGLTDSLRESMRSPRAFEQALVGDFSPLSLAEQIVEAFRCGRRSPAATAFQLVELVRVVSELQPKAGAVLSRREEEELGEVRARGIERLLALAGNAAGREDFRQVCGDGDFSQYVAASLSAELAGRWEATAMKGRTLLGESKTGERTEDTFQ